MLPFTLYHPDGQRYCCTEYDADEHWLLATWQGFVTAQHGESGAATILQLLELKPVACLLNDNSQVTGPWFDSVDWLQRVWAPQARQLGLRYVAHVVQPHTAADISPYLERQPFAGLFELQLFTDKAVAAEWLRSCQPPEQQRANRHLRASQITPGSQVA